jgi:microcin C transport system permease protein
MGAYITRRLLLMIPTLVGITVLCFALIQAVPGGPVEEMIARVQASSAERGQNPNHSLSEEEVNNIKAYYGFDQPAWKRYFIWVSKVVRLDLGHSFSYEEPVWDVVSSRFPISLFFGLSAFFLSYLISVPLGIRKAVQNGTRFDFWSSIAVFSGYVMPGYALGILLLMFFAGGSYFDWFPLGGIVSDNFESLTFFGKVSDFLYHMVLPMSCYMLGEFAFLTMLMKNSLLEEISRDYMRTALMKGLSPRRAIWKHALRNALIPIATRMSEIFTLMFAGALLIEKVFDIDGMGLLYYNAMVHRDYNVVMGVILLSSIMVLLGRLFADILYVVVDPRIELS